MSRTPELRDWHIEVTELMARTGCSLKQAVTELNLEVTQDECNSLFRRAFFNKLLWEARHRYFNSLGGSINLKKETAVGKLYALAQKLEEDGEYDAAADVIFKAAKVSGFVGPESQVSVFGELSQADLDAIKKSLEKPSSSIVLEAGPRDLNRSSGRASN